MKLSAFPSRGRAAIWLNLALISVVAVASAAGACSATNSGSSDNNGDTNGQGGAGGHGGGTIFPAGTGGTAPQPALAIAPVNPSIQVEYGTPGVTVPFTATDPSGQVVNPTWSLNTPEAGTISQDGVFTSNGLAGGEILVTANLNGSTASTTLTINLHVLENPGGITPGDQGTITGGAPQPDGGWQMLYPYDGTVFPRGILPPELHTQGGAAASAYYLKITMAGCAYEGFFAPAAQIAMSEGAWNALGSCSTGGDAAVELKKLSGGQVYGPLSRTWRIAKGKLHGVIYYNTYDSALAGNNGAMMRIKGNSAQPEVLAGNCTVCHSISSDGSTAAAANHNGPGGTFDLSSGNVNPPLVWTDPERAAFAALYPKNGEVLVINGAPGGNWPPNTPGTSGNWLSELRTKSGTLIPASGIEGYYAQTPVFSHDGTMLAFTNRPAGGGPSILALLDYDPATQKFADYRVLGTPPGGRHYSWPAFTPDNRFVVYQDGVGEDLATWNDNTGRLRAVDVQTNASIDLTRLNGDGYMPAGARDENLNYEPTILPVASGGYFWVMFTSRRTYGNRLTGNRYETKRLWVAAFDANAQPGTDPTHPAFYIAGQELTSGNSRGFWALDPCAADGQSCESGDQCCNGFCNPSSNDPNTYVCGQPDGTCSDEFENCTTSADCCSEALECIGGKCSQIPPE